MTTIESGAPTPPAAAGRWTAQWKELYAEVITQDLCTGCAGFEHLVALQDEVLADTPTLALSLKRRDPYLDPLSHIQILMLNRYRDEQATETEQDTWLNPLLRTISAVAAGMRNTG